MRLSEDIGSVRKDNVKKSGGFCFALREYFFPDKEKIAQDQLKKFDDIIKNYQRQINEKESEAIQSKEALLDIMKSKDTKNKVFIHKELKDKIKSLLAEIKILRKYQAVFKNYKMRLQMISNTSLMNSEGKVLEKNFNIDLKEVVKTNHAISDIDTAMKEADARVEHMSQNIWLESDKSLEEEFKLLLDDIDEDISIPSYEPEVEPTKRAVLA